MNQYLVLGEYDIANEILLEYVMIDNKQIHISERFSPDFLAKCIEFPDSFNIPLTKQYVRETGEFRDPIYPDPPAPPSNIEARLEDLEGALDILLEGLA